MRLAVARQGAGSVLYVEAGAGYLPLETAAQAVGVPGLEGREDVADLYRAGDHVVEAAREVADRAGEVPLPRSPLEDLQLRPPILRPASIVCIGRNYLEHIQEGKVPVPEYPILFSKFPNTLVGSGEKVLAHGNLTEQLDYEGELAVVIGRQARAVAAPDAMSVVAGYTILNDVSARDLQYRDLQWIRGKSLDTWCPLGPVFVSADEIPDPYELRLQTRVNGEVRQDASCSEMLFKIPELIAFITEGIILEPGDIIATGTPSGVGLGFNPPKWLHPGDVVEVTVEPIGTLRSVIA